MFSLAVGAAPGEVHDVSRRERAADPGKSVMDFRREVLEGLGLDEVQTVGYGFQIELTWRALQRGYSVVEVPIRFVDRVAGQSKMSGAIFREALTLVWKLRLGL